MPILISSYNPLTIRLVLAVIAVLLVLGSLLYWIHSGSKHRKSAHAPETPSAEPETASAKPETAGKEMFQHSVRPGAPVLRDILRFALVLLAFCVAAGLVVIVLPQGMIDRMAQNLRLRHPEAVQQEKISLLYLGDETKDKEFHIRGTVRNISTQPIEKLDAAVRLYAPDGSLLETLVIHMDTDQIAPDAISSFHLIYPDYKGQFASYAVDFKLRQQGETLPYKDMRRES